MKILFILLASLGVALTTPSKIDIQLLKTFQRNEVANVVVTFADTKQVLDTVNSMKFGSRGSKIRFMKVRLEELAESSQRNIHSLLSSRSIKFKSFWINNRIYVDNASLELVQSIAAIPEVVQVREEITDIHIIGSKEWVIQNKTNDEVEWGVAKIEAPEAWSMPGGNSGRGVVVAVIDTGARPTHEAIRNNFRSQYGWYDPYMASRIPFDDLGHGTHVTGTIVGQGGIGVAPQAQWISCLMCSRDSCLEQALITCGQWATCPTLPDGFFPNCDFAPQIVSNSWGSGQGSDWYDSVLDAWHAAGIIPVFAMGNSGPECGTASSPGDSEKVIAVGASDPSDTIAFFSSRGPAVTGGIKPDVTAPGVNIRSAWYTGDDDYVANNGTSEATPHVSGVIALLISQNPKLSFTEIKEILQNNTARELGPAEACGDTPPTQFPNNIYGHGRINARRSLEAAINTK